MKLSQNFTLAEFTKSDTAKANGYTEQFEPTKEIIEKLTFGAEKIAEKIRVKFGAFTLNCAYRCPRLNDKVGGKKSSMHLTAEAMDVTFKDCKAVYEWLIENKDSIPFTELYWEKNKKRGSEWLHIGWRKQVNQEIGKIFV